MPSEVSICNKALRYIGAEEIASLSQESRGARLCAQYYPEVRDELLEAHHWNFATRYAVLPQVAQEPPFGFLHAYRLPQDCLRVRRVLQHAAGVLQGGAAVADDETGIRTFEVVEGGILYTDASPARAVMTVRVTETACFPALFAEALARKLAADMAVALTGSTRLYAGLRDGADKALDTARTADAGEEHADPQEYEGWLRARWI
ncbi:hypothetical protein Dde_2546 [Oleidesulfovibrio alaskensis G20]|jgi:hypothetical protein|uniref:Uncharacterized protein n=1 Tax=Oleidesulfovibrio alaskensis (strain ATCC BAA-1058 / DSM 17464 / G20) TaxID=207559 RepID=Q30YA4_OLEA2|nr:hypothetical protein [Oleidesulfovibrio alaskensis]ABB39342.2 hypothetical protein Dde_2546 [Oleidesulfovibrio alaskensis G20]MBG0773780.1 hypothetical protein [Oleidesulfovibrio alaskensis]MBL3581827.1 hypothetical protein [Oleidesulfovibrio alaskensis]